MSRPTDVLHLDRPLDREVVRLFQAHAGRARRALRDPNDEAVHTARKAVKRARSLLRLVRGALLDARYRDLDRALRAIGRRTGALRDAAVAADLADRLEADGVLGGELAARLHTPLDALRDEARARLTADDGIETLQADLRALRLTRDDIAGIDVLTVHDGLVRTYAQGRDLLSRSLGSPTSEVLHAWRRQVKHHGVHLHLLVPAWPAPLRGAERAVGDLSDALGDDHDLSELDHRAAEAGLSRGDREALRSATRPLRDDLQAAAWAHGARIYAEPPATLGARLTAYLVAGLNDACTTPLPALNGWALAAPRPLGRVSPELVH